MRNTAPVFLMLAAALPAQDLGHGNLGANRREPLLELRAAGPGGTLGFRVSQLAPRGSVLLLISGASAEIPLGALGLPNAILGLDLATLLMTPALPVSASGVVDVRIPVPAAWDGVHVYVQALHVDPQQSPPLVFSDSRSMTVHSATAPLVLAADAGGTALHLERWFADGTAGTPLPRLRSVRMVDLTLASIDEQGTFRDERPTVITTGGRRAIRLADGSSLLLVRHGTSDELLRVHASGRVERIVQAPAGQIQACLAANTRAVVIAGRTKLWLYNLRGNWAGTAEPVRQVALPVGVSAASLVAGSRVAAYPDKRTGVYLIRYADGVVFRPRMPNSGGRAPVFFDEEIAVSADGRSFALGAGPGKKLKDIYVIRDDGTGINVTKRVTDYAEVGYTNPGRRSELVLNADGTLVSYVDTGGKEAENFVSRVLNPKPIHITSSRAFVNSIDIGTTSRFPIKGKGGALIIAGLNATRLDVFFSPSISDRDVRPLTRTGTATKPPFARDSKLSMLDLGSLPRAPQFVLWAKHATKPTAELLALDPARGTSRQIAANYAGLGRAIPNSPGLLVADAAEVVLANPTDATQAFAKRIRLGRAAGALVHDLAVDRAGSLAAAAFGTATSGELWVVDLRKATARRTGAGTENIRTVFAGSGAQQVSALGAGALWRWTAATGLKKTRGGRFLFFVLR